MVSESAQLGLSEMQLTVLRHLRTFRITTPDELHQRFFQGDGTDAVKSLAYRLRTRGLLESVEYLGKRAYYHLSDQGCRLIDAPPSYAQPVNGNQLIEHLAMLAYCRPDRRRFKLNRTEFEQKFPELCESGLVANNYYIDDDGDVRRIGFIYVDRGAPAYRHKSRISNRVIRRRVKLPNWRANVIDAQRFAVGVVVPTQEKAAELAPDLRRSWPYVTFRFEVASQLLAIITRSPLFAAGGSAGSVSDEQ